MQKLADIFGTDDLSAIENMKKESTAPNQIVPVLRFEAGPLKGTRFPLSDKKVTLGRVRDNSIQIDNDTSVSRYHAELSLTGDTYVVRDLNSSNGTLVNGTLIAPSVPLNNGDRITLGESEIIFVSDPDDPRIKE